jgi:hypothetical protein
MRIDRWVVVDAQTVNSSRHSEVTTRSPRCTPRVLHSIISIQRAGYSQNCMINRMMVAVDTWHEGSRFVEHEV